MACPSCGGSGRRRDQEPLVRDVTKTKASHYESAAAKKKSEKRTWPSTPSGEALAREVQKSGCSEEESARLIRDVIEHEDEKGLCTKTFARKLRRQLRPAS